MRDRIVQCGFCTAMSLRSEAIENGWSYVMRNAWRCYFCVHDVDEPLCIVTIYVLEVVD